MALLAALRALDRGDRAAPAMVDLAFTIEGQHLPADYPFALEAALLRALPWLADEAGAGVHPVRAPLTDFGLVLSRRARLVLRIPQTRIDAARSLCGTELAVAGAGLRIGSATARSIEPFATLRAWLVATSADDEQGFLDDVALQLDALGVVASPMCGRPSSLGAGAGRLAGYALVLHGISPAHSLRLQAAGLGAGRRVGCGLFVHHKIIEGLEAMPE